MRTQDMHAGGAILKLDIREVGYIKSVRESIAIAANLPSCINGQIVEFQSGGFGLVMGFIEDEVQILILKSDVTIRAGDEVYNKGRSLSFPAGEAFLGRTINSLCEPVDNLGPVESDELCPVFADPARVMDRVPVNKTFETGTVILDAIIPIAKGQRQLLLGDRLTGKTTVVIDAILNQKGKNVICIYCCIGKPQVSFLKLCNLLTEYGALPYTIVIDATASLSVGEQYLSPYTAAMLGEYFMKRGRDVLVIFDDLTKHAWIYRQIALLLGRTPGREAYPGDIFYIHSQLMERAGFLKPELGAGSMTFFPIVEILQGDITGYIPTNIISMTDGQIYFGTDLFNRGFKPAIDFGLSVSRIGNRAQWPAMKEVSRHLKLDYIQYQEVLQMSQLRTSALSKDAEERLKKGKIIIQLIMQNKNKPMPIEKQVVYLYALNIGILYPLDDSEITRFKKDFFDYLKNKYPDIVQQICKSREFSDTIKEGLNKALNEFFETEKKKEVL